MKDLKMTQRKRLIMKNTIKHISQFYLIYQIDFPKMIQFLPKKSELIHCEQANKEIKYTKRKTYPLKKEIRFSFNSRQLENTCIQ